MPVGACACHLPRCMLEPLASADDHGCPPCLLAVQIDPAAGAAPGRRAGEGCGAGAGDGDGACRGGTAGEHVGSASRGSSVDSRAGEHGLNSNGAGRARGTRRRYRRSYSNVAMTAAGVALYAIVAAAWVGNPDARSFQQHLQERRRQQEQQQRGAPMPAPPAWHWPQWRLLTSVSSLLAPAQHPQLHSNDSSACCCTTTTTTAPAATPIAAAPPPPIGLAPVVLW